MEFKELIRDRRSVRNYSEAISREDLTSILDDARMAPSWKNSQTYRCYAVTDPEKTAAFREAVLPPFNAKNSANAAYIVTTFVKGISGYNGDVPANEAGDFWGAYDLGLHDAYLILSARDRGYDTLIMGIREAAAIRDLLEIPGDEEILSVIAIGKRAAEPAFRPRKELAEVAKFF